jgi:hypothetical protein
MLLTVVSKPKRHADTLLVIFSFASNCKLQTANLFHLSLMHDVYIL